MLPSPSESTSTKLREAQISASECIKSPRLSPCEKATQNSPSSSDSNTSLNSVERAPLSPLPQSTLFTSVQSVVSEAESAVVQQQVDPITADPKWLTQTASQLSYELKSVAEFIQALQALQDEAVCARFSQFDKKELAQFTTKGADYMHALLTSKFKELIPEHRLQELQQMDNFLQDAKKMVSGMGWARKRSKPASSDQSRFDTAASKPR